MSRTALEAVKITSGIPPRKNRKDPVAWCKDTEKKHHKVENIFAKLKDWCRIAMRYDRCAHIFLSAICLAATVIFWLDERVLTLKIEGWRFEFNDVSHRGLERIASDPEYAAKYLEDMADSHVVGLVNISNTSPNGAPDSIHQAYHEKLDRPSAALDRIFGERRALYDTAVEFCQNIYLMEVDLI